MLYVMLIISYVYTKSGSDYIIREYEDDGTIDCEKTIAKWTSDEGDDLVELYGEVVDM